MRPRTLVLAAALAVVGGAALFLHLRGGSDEATMASSAPSQGEGRPAAAGARVEPARPTLTAPSAPAGERVANVAAPAPPDEAANAPVDPTPATREEALTAEERDPRLKRAVQLLDETIARTEAKLAEAEKAGDTATANTARIRIAKLKEVRDLRARELEASP